MQENGVDNNAVFGALYLVDFARLSGNRHIFMDNADAAFTGDGNRHGGFRNRIHASAHHRDIQFDIFRQIRRYVYLVRQHVGFRRYQQNIIKS